MPNGSTTRSVIGAILARVLVPLHVLIGAVAKFMTARPEALPEWMIRTVQRMEWKPFDDPLTMLPGEADEKMLMAILRAILCIEFIAAGIMFFSARFARPMAIAILAAFLLVLGAEISFKVSVENVGVIEAAFENDCACYGEKGKVSLGAMVLIDAALLAGVVAFRPRRAEGQAMPRWAQTALVAWMIAGLVAGLNPIKPDPTQQVPWHLRSPYYWIDHPFINTPLASELDILPSDFGPRKQTWILYRETCGDCQALFDEKYAEEIDDRVLVAVRVPPAPDAIIQTDPLTMTCPSCNWIELPEGKSYEYDTPLEIFIDEEGIITGVRSRKLEASGGLGFDL